MANHTDPAPAGKPDNSAPPAAQPASPPDGEIKRSCYLWDTSSGWCLTLTRFFARKAAEDTHFVVLPLASDWGRAFRLTKVTGTPEEVVYDVLLAADKPTCTCAWATYNPDGKPCRHAAALLHLQGLGKLDCLPAPQQPAPKGGNGKKAVRNGATA
jgi:hypothetical protein